MDVFIDNQIMKRFCNQVIVSLTSQTTISLMKRLTREQHMVLGRLHKQRGRWELTFTQGLVYTQDFSPPAYLVRQVITPFC